MTRSRQAWGGAALALAALALGCVAGAGPFAGDDRGIILGLAPLREHPAVWLLLTRLGDGDARVLFCALISWVLWRRGDRRAALFLPIAALAETLATSGLKAAFGRARPDLLPHLDPVTSLSYPSGHAAHNLALWLMAAMLLMPERRWPVAAACGFAMLIGMSRIVLGVHWPTDIAGGLLFGAGAALIALSIHRQSGTIAAPVT